MAEGYQDQSVFNMALAYLKRIDKLLYLCQGSAIRGDADSWLNHLRGVYREVSVKLSDDEKKEITGMGDKIDLKTLLDANITEKESTFKSIYFLINNPAYKVTHKNIILFLLDSLEIKLRFKLQKKGMLLPSKDNPNTAVLDM